VLKPVGWPLPLPAWLAIPLLFAAAVLGVTAILGLLLDADWSVTLSPALFGAAAAVTGFVGFGAEWPRGRKLVVRLGYPAVLCITGLAIGGIPVPTAVAMIVGLPALATVGYLYRQVRPRRSVVVD